RHLLMTTPAVADFARSVGLPVMQAEKLNSDEFLQQFKQLGAEVGVVVAFGRFIPGRLLRLPRYGFVNLHPSLLPRHRGPAPIQWAIYCGDQETGVTTMLLDEGMDTGPILLQRSTPIDPREHAPQLEARLATLGAELMVETLEGLVRRRIHPKPQDHSQASVTPKLERKMGRVDWNLTADELARRCRAFDPWPGLFCNFRGGRLKIHGFRAVDSPPGEEPPGTVLAVEKTGILVRCGGGTAGLLTELQREGRRRLPADAFILGERVVRGEQFR
ncbi:MAG: methionyl-tRNA formyltransferase, partial [Thermoanaerobaculum sp.]|nr:methionyl-tRNA formyltransferase [Thermoanaerobaculum sp.]MDW7967150.1 methionyl-tRNA formyltransferase [Thermoanaerobaculum sp.]